MEAYSKTGFRYVTFVEGLKIGIWNLSQVFCDAYDPDYLGDNKQYFSL